MAKKQTSSEAGTEAVQEAILTKEQQSLKIVKKYMLWSLGAGLIPFPLVDIATVTGVQIKMVSELSKIYNVEFSENRARNVISPILSSVTAKTFAAGTVGSTIKAIPIIGTLVGSITMPLFSSAFAYALGQIFINHFEKGGTFLDFDVEKNKENFAEMFKKGKNVASELKEEVKS
ncbi:MAG: YcjF family protein [Balneolales bacterium]|nr:YcjF family protein [Balneolales bacterium]